MQPDAPVRSRRRTVRLASTLTAAVLIPAGVVAISVWPSQAATTPTSSGVYTLADGASGKCVDVTGASTANSALLIQVACNAAATDQQWTAVGESSGQYNLANVNSGRCIDVPSGATTSGLQVQQYGCGDGTKTNQLWTFTASSTSGKYVVKNVASGLCLSDQGGSTAGNNPIVQETCSDIARMQWSFNYVSGPTTAPTTTGPTSGGRTWSNNADGFAATGGGTIGGAGGTTVTVTTYADLVKYAAMTAAYVIRISGSITYPTYGYEIPIASNKTLIGVGKTAELVHGGLHMNPGTHNVIIRNLTIRDTQMADDDPDDKVYDYDGIQMDTADHVWIDHNTIERMNDGLIDSRLDTTYETVSWNVLAYDNKAYGIGWTTNVTSRITIHHNWIHDNNQRNPSTDNVAYAHLYDNYMQNLTSYGNLSRGSTRMVIENSYYSNVNNPYYRDTTAASLTISGSVVVNCTGTQDSGGTTFTPGSFYSYTLDPASSLPSLLATYAGPQANIGV